LRGSLGLAVRLKWPNDIVYGNRKLGGILTESVLKGNDLQGIIIGVGLNVLQEKHDFPDDLKSRAISLRMIIKKGDISREEVLADIINELKSSYELVIMGKSIELLDKWKANTSTIGSRVRIELEDGTFFEGTAEGLNESGALMVRDTGGRIRTVVAGDCVHIDEQ